MTILTIESIVRTSNVLTVHLNTGSDGTFKNVDDAGVWPWIQEHDIEVPMWAVSYLPRRPFGLVPAAVSADVQAIANSYHVHITDIERFPDNSYIIRFSDGTDIAGGLGRVQQAILKRNITVPDWADEILPRENTTALRISPDAFSTPSCTCGHDSLDEIDRTGIHDAWCDK